MGPAQIDGTAITGGKQSALAVIAAIPDRSDGMDHVPSRQPISPGNPGAARLATTQDAAFGKKLRSGRTMDSAVDAATAE